MYLAERKGFEPLVPLQAHTISSRACSSTPAPLRDEVIQIFVGGVGFARLLLFLARRLVTLDVVVDRC